MAERAHEKKFGVANIREMQIKTTMSSHFTVAKIKKYINIYFFLLIFKQISFDFYLALFS